MKRIVCIFLCFLLLVSCTPTERNTGEECYRFTDDTGREVILSTAPKKVAVLFSSFAEMWTLAGGKVSVTVGETIERGFAPEGTFLVDDGAGKTISHELLLASEADFVIASADIAAQRETAELFSSLDIPAAMFRVECFEDYKRVMGVFCMLTEREDLYALHVTAVEEEVQQVLAAVPTDMPPKQILFVRCGSGYSATKAKTAKNHFVCGMLDQLGTKNIAEDADALLTGLDALSMEEILRRDPDYIFFSTMGDEQRARAYMDSLLKEDAWQSLTAVKTGHYAYLPKDLFQYKPNHRFGEAYRYLWELLYEEPNI